MRTVVDAGGDAAAYRRDRWKQGKWWWWMGPGGSMRFAGRGRFTQMRCPAELTSGGAAGGQSDGGGGERDASS